MRTIVPTSRLHVKETQKDSDKSKLETHLEAQLPSLTVQYFSYLLPSVYSIIYSVGKVCDKFLILSRFDPISFQEESELLPYCSRMQVVFYHS